MAYAARPKELLEQLDCAAGAFPDISADQRGLWMAFELPRYQNAIASWTKERESLLQDLLRVLEEKSPDKVQAVAWTERITRAAETFSSLWSAPLSGAPSILAIAFQIRSAQAEKAFFTALTAAKTAAAARDYFARYHRAVDQKTESLAVRWKELETQHTGFDQEQAEIAQQLAEMLEGAAQAVAAAHKTGLEKVLAAAAAVTKIGGVVAPGVLGVAVDHFAGYLELKSQTHPALWSRYYEYLDAFRREHTTTLVSLAAFRKDAREFVKEYGYEPHVTNTFNDAKRDLDQLGASDALTPALRVDGADFAAPALATLGAHVNEAKSKWDKFYNDNDTRFLGPLADDEKERLTSYRTWSERVARLERGAASLNEAAQQLYSATRNDFAVDSSGLTSAEAAEIKRLMRADMEKLAAAMEETQARLREATKWKIGIEGKELLGRVE